MCFLIASQSLPGLWHCNRTLKGIALSVPQQWWLATGIQAGILHSHSHRYLRWLCQWMQIPVGWKLMKSSGTPWQWLWSLISSGAKSAAFVCRESHCKAQLLLLHGCYGPWFLFVPSISVHLSFAGLGEVKPKCPFVHFLKGWGRQSLTLIFFPGEENSFYLGSSFSALSKLAWGVGWYRKKVVFFYWVVILKIFGFTVLLKFLKWILELFQSTFCL